MEKITERSFSNVFLTMLLTLTLVLALPFGIGASGIGTDDGTVFAGATEYKVTFNSQGGSTVKTKNVAPGTNVGALSSPKNKNMSFKGWYTKSVGGKKITKNTKVNKDTVFYAHWSVKKGYVQATFKAHGYNIYKGYKKNAKLGSAAIKKVTRSGYSFKGWFTKKSGGVKITKSKKISKNTTYYARWKKDDSGEDPGEDPGEETNQPTVTSLTITSSSYNINPNGSAKYCSVWFTILLDDVSPDIASNGLDVKETLATNDYYYGVDDHAYKYFEQTEKLTIHQTANGTGYVQSSLRVYAVYYGGTPPDRTPTTLTLSAGDKSAQMGLNYRAASFTPGNGFNTD
jgi:uncharacterized repeat protein (TIGR02543 family)